MNAIKYLAAAASLICASALVSCEKDDAPENGIDTHVYLSVADGNTTLTACSGESITVDVTLSTAPSADLKLTLALTEGGSDYLSLDGMPVTIAAGTTTGSFTVTADRDLDPNEQQTFSFVLTDGATDLKENVTITVLPSNGAIALTPEQKILVEAWKSKYGIDITPWLGNISLTGTLQFPGDGSRDPFVAPSTVSLAGSTLFALSDESDENTPVLDMKENPMGMSDYLYKTLRQLTVDDREYFALEDDGLGLELMELINWDANSTETFAVSLPGLRITSIANGKATVEFVKTGENYIYGSNGKPIFNAEYDMDLTYNWATSWIPFKYDFSAWNRQLSLVEAGNPTALELLTYGVSAAPATYLGVNDVLEDVWEVDEDEDGVANLYVYPRGEIDFNAGTMTFEFPFDHADQYGYSRVKVVYSLK